MATIEFLGGEETGNVGRVPWGAYVFELNKAVECSDPHIIKKAMGNKFFRVGGDTSAAAAAPEKVAPDDTPTPDEEDFTEDLPPEPEPPVQALAVPEPTEEPAVATPRRGRPPKAKAA